MSRRPVERDSADPPNWLRIVGLVFFPVGLVGTVVAFVVLLTALG